MWYFWESLIGGSLSSDLGTFSRSRYSSDVLPLALEKKVLVDGEDGGINSGTGSTSTDLANDVTAGSVTPPSRAPSEGNGCAAGEGRENLTTAPLSPFPAVGDKELGTSIVVRERPRIGDTRFFDGKSMLSSPITGVYGDPELGKVPPVRRISRENDPLITGGVGRARLWQQMMLSGEEERATSCCSSILATIVAENAQMLDQGLVLPCAPTDEEKVMYHETGRGFLVSMGVISVVSLSTGMWLFTLATPFFYWFGLPTSFLMGYLLLSYVGVAMWGKNFDPEGHEDMIRTAQQNGYYPTVDVYLPVCGEPTHLLDNTWMHVGALDYPNVTVHVLDDGGNEEVRHLARMYGFNYIRRDNRPELKKAGNLRYAFARTSGEIIVIFDADFCPRPDFLRETTPYFVNPDVAILQTPQFFRRREEQTWIERGAGVTQELFYRMVQVNRDMFDAAICVGTCGVYRRAALVPFGGTAAIGYSEDVHTGFNCTQLGFKVKYIPQVLAMGTCPDEPRAFFMQQYRWCMGSMALVSNNDFWRSNLTVMQKLCYVSGALYYAATAMAIFTGPLPGLLLIWFRPRSVLWYNISFAVPSILFSVVVMRNWAKQTFGISCMRVKVIQSFSHLYAFKDHLMNTAIPWIPTGGGASSRSSSQAYDSSVRLMLHWTTVATLLTVGGAAWRMHDFPWYHFLPTMVLSTTNFALNISTIL